METREYHTVDKSTWQAGVWQSEPDKRQWKDEATGLPCLIVRGPSGSLCGYVGVPSDHPLHNIGYSQSAPLPAEVVRQFLERRGYTDLYREEMENGTVEVQSIISVHGGLTFAGACGHGDDEARGICHVPALGEPDDVWWFGFDCAHAGDFSPKMNPCLPPSWQDRLGAPTGWGSVIEYRDVAYVEAECHSLAKQLAALVS